MGFCPVGAKEIGPLMQGSPWEGGYFPEHLRVSHNPLWDRPGTGNRCLQPTQYQTLPLSQI